MWTYLVYLFNNWKMDAISMLQVPIFYLFIYYFFLITLASY